MLKYITVAVSSPLVAFGAEELPSPTAISREQVTFEVKHVIADVMREMHAFRRGRYDPPGYLVLGWQTWVLLGYEMSSYTDLYLRPGEFMGAKIIVDDTVEEGITVLPELNNVRVGR
jgi:hypothetical protein